MQTSLHDRLLSAQNQVDPEGGVEGCRRALLSSGLLCYVGGWSVTDGEFRACFVVRGGGECEDFAVTVPSGEGERGQLLSCLWSCWLHGLLGLVPPEITSHSGKISARGGSEKSSAENEHLIEEPSSVASKPAGSRIRVGP